jgi:hypothetical protein
MSRWYSDARFVIALGGDRGGAKLSRDPQGAVTLLFALASYGYVA